MKTFGVVHVAVVAAGLFACTKKNSSEGPRGDMPNDAIHRGGLEGASRESRMGLAAAPGTMPPGHPSIARSAKAMPPGHPPITGTARAMGDSPASDEVHEGNEHDAPNEKLPPVIIDGKKGDAAEGAQLFAQLCATCHGKGGAGGGIMASGNLTDGAWQASRTDQQIGVVISHGKPKTKMPSFMDKMDLQKLNDLVAHIRTLNKK
ncbi:MAG: cytochrome c [Deltaproteobacteria bacterium]|nr:cytochrome c [Deltaproteobacteria bacterium]